MSFTLALLLQAATAAACGDSLRVSVDRESFSAAAHRPRPDLETQVRTGFASAAAQACAQGWLRAEDLASYDTLMVQNGEGATEPLLYFDENRGWRTLILQYAFQAGEAPPPERISAAIRCWREPEREECFGG